MNYMFSVCDVVADGFPRGALPASAGGITAQESWRLMVCWHFAKVKIYLVGHFSQVLGTKAQVFFQWPIKIPRNDIPDYILTLLPIGELQSSQRDLTSRVVTAMLWDLKTNCGVKARSLLEELVGFLIVRLFSRVIPALSGKSAQLCSRWKTTWQQIWSDSSATKRYGAAFGEKSRKGDVLCLKIKEQLVTYQRRKKKECVRNLATDTHAFLHFANFFPPQMFPLDRNCPSLILREHAALF